MEHFLPIKKKFHYLYDNGKDLEVRRYDRHTRKIHRGDIVFSETLRRRVKDIRRYSSLEEMFEKEDSDRIAPGISKEVLWIELLKLYPYHPTLIIVFELIK